MAIRKFYALMIGLGLLAGVSAGCEGDLSTALGVGDATPEPVATPAPTPTPIPTPTPELTPTPPPPVHASLARNVAFDMQRSRGITQVYEGKTLRAVTTFKGAQRMKPEDVSVKLWLGAIKKAVEKPREAAPMAGSEFEDVSRRLRGAAAPVVVPPPAAAPAGSAPGLPRPVSIATPNSVDPRMVF